MVDMGILAVENCMQSSVSGPFDILSVASLEKKRLFPEEKKDLFNLRIITDDGLPVTCFNGMKLVPHMGKEACESLDILFIPVIYKNLAPLLTNRQLIGWLQDQNQKGTVICAVCAGVFLAAETGLLAQRQATTHWHLADAFQKRYPDVVLKQEKMIVDAGDFITAGGVTAYMDLSLYLVGRFGSNELASSVSKALLIDPSRRLQTPYTRFDFNIVHNDENILEVQHWMETHYADPISVLSLGKTIGLGERTFARRFKRATGDTPLEYLQHLRIGKARALLETTGESIDAVTRGVGY
jgi:transcriptional regulator GlxA family with amidase domain